MKKLLWEIISVSTLPYFVVSRTVGFSYLAQHVAFLCNLAGC